MPNDLRCHVTADDPRTQAAVEVIEEALGPLSNDLHKLCWSAPMVIALYNLLIELLTLAPDAERIDYANVMIGGLMIVSGDRPAGGTPPHVPPSQRPN